MKSTTKSNQISNINTIGEQQSVADFVQIQQAKNQNPYFTSQPSDLQSQQMIVVRKKDLQNLIDLRAKEQIKKVKDDFQKILAELQIEMNRRLLKLETSSALFQQHLNKVKNESQKDSNILKEKVLSEPSLLSSIATQQNAKKDSKEDKKIINISFNRMPYRRSDSQVRFFEMSSQLSKEEKQFQIPEQQLAFIVQQNELQEEYQNSKASVCNKNKKLD